MRIMISPGVLAAAAATALSSQAQTTPPAQLDPVVISAERSRQTTFDAAAAITAVTRDAIEAAGPQVNLSEVLNRVPGITVLNRQNYAQDLQLSIRGFGSRSTFGIRGVRLIIDGIPATMPDGQGQASSIALSSAARIEVLRGPMAQLYGNAAGGVVQVFTEIDAKEPTATATVAVGPFGQNKVGIKLSAGGANDAVTLDASNFHTSGYREHSTARREQLNAKWQHDASPDTRVSLVLNALEQPDSLDPLGLTRAQWEANPRQAAAPATLYDTSKSVAQRQLGGVLEQRLSDATTLTARVHFGQRELANALSTPLANQQAPTSAGGIVQFERSYSGLGVQIAHRARLGEGIALRLTGGIDLDDLSEDRRGYINNFGVQGALKRNERDTSANRDAYAQVALDLGPAWTATAGVRSSHVKFRSTDFFITSTNPDDSGGVDYSATLPVLGVTWHAVPTLNLYANAGRGFETPTFTELAYRPVGTGLNTDLLASSSRHAEIGAKWKAAPGHRIDLALFDIATRDEIVVDTNNGGRSTFKNASRTKRSGAELSWFGQYGPAWRATVSASVLRSRFAENFVSGAGPSAVTVPAGNRLPGTPNQSVFAELAWTPQHAWGGFNAAAELVHTGKLYVNDANDDAAPGATLLNLRAGLSQPVGDWTFTQLLRIDNAGDKRYAGSVIVNDANKRYFEPALPRNWLLSAQAKLTFR